MAKKRQQQPVQEDTVADKAKRVLGFLDDVCNQLGLNPSAVMAIGVIGPDSGFYQDVLDLANIAMQSVTKGDLVVDVEDADAFNDESDQYEGDMEEDEPEQRQPARPKQAKVDTKGDFRLEFMSAMRTSALFPDASDENVGRPTLTLLVQSYAHGMLDQLRRIKDGWKAVAAFEKKWGQVLQLGWVADKTWAWWHHKPPRPKFLNNGGGVGAATAQHMGW